MEIKDLENLAELARIKLTEEEKVEILKDMGSILGCVNAIQKTETGATEEEYKIHNVWREDEADKREFSLNLILDQFPDKKDNFLKVKKIL